ncbi:hypothetical protein BJF79_04805 [Actinomadura sp. CNU-125]|nr:hypothetical protein BJF79_04805 [Actinomadura sp. CNU-125]
MVDSVLLRFLSKGLVDLGGDDTRLEKLQQVAKDLTAALGKTSSKAVAFSLVAFDPETPDDDPVVSEVVDVLKKHWATYANVIAGTPVLLVRAVLLDALAQAVAGDECLGVAFVGLARNILPHMEVAAEQEIWAEVVSEIEGRVDARTEREWATPSSITVSAPKIQASESSRLPLRLEPVDRDQLGEQYQAAAGPQTVDSQGRARATNGNPQALNNLPHWIAEFGPRMAEATADAIDAAVSESSVDQTQLTGTFEKLLTDVSAYVDETLKTVSAATAGLQRRTDLLWWKQALFSPSTRCSYRDLSPEAAASLMAFDLHQQIPAFSPASVTAFLFEAVHGLPAVDPSKTCSIHELVAMAREDDRLVALRENGADLVASPAGRGPLLSLIAHPEARASHAEEEEFRRLTGLRPETQLTLPDWAVWVFRELQAVRAAKQRTSGSRRRRKA